MNRRSFFSAMAGALAGAVTGAPAKATSSYKLSAYVAGYPAETGTYERLLAIMKSRESYCHWSAARPAQLSARIAETFKNRPRKRAPSKVVK